MKVQGRGKAKVDFRLRTDDDPDNSGMFASRIKIGKGSNDSVDLKRSKDGDEVKEKEIITDSASFEAGREYIVQTFHANKDAGHIFKNEGKTMEFDDNMREAIKERKRNEAVLSANKSAKERGLSVEEAEEEIVLAVKVAEEEMQKQQEKANKFFTKFFITLIAIMWAYIYTQTS